MARPKVNARLYKQHIGIRIPTWILEGMKSTGGVQKHIDNWLEDSIKKADPWLLTLIADFASGVSANDQEKIVSCMIVSQTVLEKSVDGTPEALQQIDDYIKLHSFT